MKSITLISIIVTTLIFSSCSNQNKQSNTESKSLAKSKIEVFNDIEKTRSILSKNGIGELGIWRSDGIGGYMSITDYFQFGGNSNTMKNNLAYYIESSNNSQIERLKIVLNINNKNEKKIALSKFKEITEKTFNSLSIEIPENLIFSIENEKEFQFENQYLNVGLKLDKSNIDTWKMIIQTK